MGLYIDGMDIPKTCDYCFLERDRYCFLTGKIDHRPEWRREIAEGRAGYCPLKELPPHGRLIDADALDDVCVRLNNEGWGITVGEHKLLDSVLF